MKINLIYITFIALTFFSCKSKEEQKSQNHFTPKVIEAKGFVVPKESMAIPKIIIIDESKLTKIPAGIPKITPTNTNVHIAPIPKNIFAGAPHIITPGTSKFMLPKKVKAINIPIIAGIPEVVIAKDAYIKDINPQNFSSFSKLQGLKHNVVRCMTQDNLGNIWYGTEGGVTKYDGKYFTHFTQKEGLVNNLVYSILQDRRGNIWFGTFGGVSKYDGKSFTNYTEREGLPNNVVWTIFQDKIGNLWFGTHGGGVSKYDGNTFTTYTEKEGLSNNIVWSIFQDKNENFWFGTDSGISKFNGKSFSNYTKNEGLSNNVVLAILQDKSGNYWFGTYGGGVCKFDGKFFTNFTKKNGLSNDIVWSIIQDKYANLWFGTDGGISIYNGNSEEIQNAFGKKQNESVSFTNYTDKDGLSNDVVLSIFQDRSGNLWFGTNGGGVSKYAGKTFSNFTKKEGLANNKVWSILHDRNGNLWFGTDEGVSKYDGKSFTNYTEREGLSNNIVWSIFQDKSGNLWFGTNGGGVSCLSQDEKIFTHYTEKDGLSNNIVNSIIQDKIGNLWFGTQSGGVSKFDGKSFTNFTEKEGLSNNTVRTILQDKSGNLWFGTYGGGVSKFDGQSFTNYTKKEGFPSDIILTILQDKNGNIWFGTDNEGVIRLSVDGKSFTTFTEKEGLSNNYVFSTLEDKNGNLWLGTRFGLNKLNAKNNRKIKAFLDSGMASSGNEKTKMNEVYFKNYGHEDGFLGIGVNSGQTICEDKYGTLWIGTNDRLIAYHPQGDEPDTIPPEVQLVDIEIYNEKVSWINLAESKIENRKEIAKDTSFIFGNGVLFSNFEFEGISNWYNLPENLSLAYNNNYLTFNYIGITQIQNNKIKYLFKLEGIDENWGAFTNQTKATYGYLPHGNYTFKVKAMNSEGYMSKEYHYSFTIRPSWWNTLIFRIAILLLVITALLSLFFWRVASLKAQQKRLEILIFEKTAEVVKQKNEILTQKNELEIANTTKDKFFRIIAHDLRGPIGSILGLTQYLTHTISGMTIKDIQKNIEVMEKSLSNINLLLGNLLEWSLISSGITTFNLQSFLLLPKIQEILGVIAEMAANKEIVVSYDIPEDLKVYADSNMLGSTIRNLVTNAIKFTPKGGKVYIKARVTEGNSVQLSVQDTGIGMSKMLLDNLFRLNSQTGRKGTDGELSSGLGLLLCKEFVEKHNGKIWVESKIGAGSTFYVSFPVFTE